MLVREVHHMILRKEHKMKRSFLLHVDVHMLNAESGRQAKQLVRCRPYAL